MANGRDRPLLERGWRYTFVGMVCALSNYVILLANDAAGGHYLVGTVIAFIVVTPIGYVLHSRFTLGEPFSFFALVRFTAAMAAAYPVSTGLLILLCSGLRLSVAIATPIAIAIMFVWNFAATHWSILPRIGLSDVRMNSADPGPAERITG